MKFESLEVVAYFINPFGDGLATCSFIVTDCTLERAYEIANNRCLGKMVKFDVVIDASVGE